MLDYEKFKRKENERATADLQSCFSGMPSAYSGQSSNSGRKETGVFGASGLGRNIEDKSHSGGKSKAGKPSKSNGSK